MATIETGIVTAQGFQPTRTLACDLGEQAQYEPAGVYTVARTYQRDKVLLLDAHLDRLEESARLENIALNLDRAALRSALRALIDKSGYAESRFRITVPRENPAQLHFAAEPLNKVPDNKRQNGVKVALIHAKRQNPVAKTTAWMQQRQEATADIPFDIYESILVSENGELLEGTGSNFYAVLNGTLRTASENILNGISRQVVLNVISEMHVLPLELRGVTVNNLPQLEEAFLTSSSRGVIPIIEIDGNPVGDGKPGQFTLELQRCYDTWTDAHLEPI